VLKPHLQEYWCIPPKQNAAFVAAMEDILDLYCQPYNPERPVIGMDEKPVQLVKEVRRPLPARPGAVARYDYEYERNGTANLFLFTEPLGGWRKVTVRTRRTSQDWAAEIKVLLETDYLLAPTVILVCDNLNTHTIAALYDTFRPEEARRLAKRLDIHYTPKHGSWLNVAECELSILSQQCLDRRIPDQPTLAEVTGVWAQERTDKQRGVDWQFTTDDARIKLKSLYPQIKF
jgi:hypothetical protein